MYAFPDFQQKFCLAFGLIIDNLRSPRSRLAGKSRQKVVCFLLGNSSASEFDRYGA